MATRGRRVRGRPPKTPLSSNRTNFLRKPKAYTCGTEGNSTLNAPLGGSPLTPWSRGAGRISRGRGRDSASKSRVFVSQLLADDDELSSIADFDVDRESDITDLDNEYDRASDDTYDDGSESDYSEESLSTVCSSISRRRVFPRRPKSPEIPDDREIPPLTLPQSSTDLLLPQDLVLQAVSVYEVLRHFRTILRLSPFLFEEFCAALLSDEQCTMLSEVHIALIKALLREEDSNNTAFGPHDLKDSINISLFFLDGMTWPEVVRSYLDGERHPEYRAALPALENPDFPFVPVHDKLKVLQSLTDLALATTKIRAEITNEGNIRYDDHCRNCHKRLGDLLCCETCSAVYHLACVDPPMEEVPEEDWLCSVCRAHQVKGVTDCISEAEKSGLLCRQEPIGYDRHGRKYWFLVRRIVVEGDGECWYYSTKAQIEELLEVLDPAEWERDLVTSILEMREDIEKQMTITEELTAAAKGNKKSVLELETANLVKVQADRALRKAQEEIERKAREEEEQRQREEEEKKRKEEEERLMELQLDKMEARGEEAMEVETMSTKVNEVVSTTAVSSTLVATTPDNTLAECTTETSTTTTTTTVETTTTTIKLSTPKDNQPDAAAEAASTPAGSLSASAITAAPTTTAEATPAGPKVMTIESLMPDAKPTLLKMDQQLGAEEGAGADAAPRKTVLVVNRDGGKVMLSVAAPSGEKKENIVAALQQTTTTSSTAATTAAMETRRILTRSKTGSLTPKQFTDSVTSTTTSLKSGKTDDLLVINKDGEITRVTRSKAASATVSSSVSQSQYFKLGMEGGYKNYTNQYSSNTLALNKHQHNEERDKRRHLSHKFSLTQTSEFKWNGTISGNRVMTVSTLRLSITQLENNLPTPFLHPNWPIHRQNWQKAVHMCQNPQDFGLALAILEACIKPVVCNPVWSEALGHARLQRITTADREEMKKREKELRKRKEEEDEGRPIVWIKYPLGLKHQVWKQKGEEYRGSGGNGWLWVSAVRNYQYVPQDTVGLRSVAAKIRNRRLKQVKPAAQLNTAKSDAETVVKSSQDKLSSASDARKQSETEMEVDPAFASPLPPPPLPPPPAASNLQDSEMGDIKCEESTNKESLEKEASENGSSNTGEQGREIVPMEVEEAASEKEAAATQDASKMATSCLGLCDVGPEVRAILCNLPPKLDVELVDVSKGLTERSFFPKVTKPYSKLDALLERRLKQEEWEKRQRSAVEQQIQWKTSLEKKKLESPSTGTTDSKAKVSLLNGLGARPGTSGTSTPTVAPGMLCYSLSCRAGGASQCFSPLCRAQSRSLLKTPTKKEERKGDASMDEEEIDIMGDKDGDKTNGSTESSDILNSIKLEMDKNDDASCSSADPKLEEEDSGEGEGGREGEGESEADDKKTVAAAATANSKSPSKATVVVVADSKAKPGSSSSSSTGAGSTPKSSTEENSDQTAVAQLLANRTGVSLSQAQQALQQAIARMSIDDLRAKLPPVRHCSDKFKLARFTKINKRAKGAKKASLPVCQKFMTGNKLKSVFVLERYELKKLARLGGIKETVGFNYNCKMNNVNWIYPCPRPIFKTAWRYRTQTLKSLAAAALQLRILWACIRWDDLGVKPPAGGTNTISTETEITTTELLKRRDIGPYGLRSEFLVRKIVVPIGVPNTPKEKYTPQRSGLRERRRAESPKQTEPSVTEKWVPEEELELWEIKQFGEKLEKQRAAVQEKVTVTSTSQQSAAQIKAQMEQQLKQQRLALQQKRLLEAGKTTTTTAGTATQVVTVQSGSAATPGAVKTVTLSTSAVPALSSSLIKQVQVQPKTIIAASPTVQGATLGTLGGTPVRPGVKVQLPGTLTLRPSNTVTLAPKPGVITTTVTAGTTIAANRLISPSQTVTPRVQVRPQVVAQGLPGQVQNVQIIQGPTGQLQVRGLLPGQQIIRLPDGRLQLITLPTTSQTVVQTSAPATTSTTASTATTAPPQVRPTVTIRPQQTIVVSSPASAAAGQSVGTVTRQVLMPTQLSGAAVSAAAALSGAVVSGASLATSAGALTSVSVAGRGTLLTPGSAAKTLLTTTAKVVQTPQLSLQSSPAAATQVLVQSSAPGSSAPTPIIIQGASGTSGPTQVLLQPGAAPQVIVQQSSQATPSAPSQILLQSPGALGGSTLIRTSAGGQGTPTFIAKTLPRTLVATTLAPVAATTPVKAATTSAAIVAAVATPGTAAAGAVVTPRTSTPTPTTVVASGTTLPAGAKYHITPQVVQQVVRQALMQNQTPEIQAKLLAMQKQYQQQQQKAVVTSSGLVVPVSTQQAVQQLQQQQQQQQQVTQQAVATPAGLQKVLQAQPSPAAEVRPKARVLTQEQRDEQARLTVCNQVLKTMLDKIEREEKIEQKRQRKQESVEEKQKRLQSAKLQGALFKHKEALKKEILRKRSLMEKNLQQDILHEVSEVMKKQRKLSPARASGGNSQAGGGGKRKPEDMTAPAIQASKSVRKRKQKIISTGALNRPPASKERLYCVCKMPYDETRFYIGCDLCSNWFHGECVDITEDQARNIDSYVCEDCRRQQENTSEELYCLCKTPYDESQFYIGCDRCQDWFHGRCVGVTKDEADSIETYICPNCMKKEAADPIALKQLSDAEYDSLAKLVKALKSHKMAWPFLRPVNPKEVPDYYEVVHEPMDLSIVEQRVQNHLYSRLSDFSKDVTKIFDNCRLYNPQDSPFFQCAEVLETYFVQKLKTMRERF